ncbi:MAG TPA: hypothetical protein VKB68_05940 [Stellaceae bacterium]|nr:hypothetical protein [Stellaceae bacterium]
MRLQVRRELVFTPLLFGAADIDIAFLLRVAIYLAAQRAMRRDGSGLMQADARPDLSHSLSPDR